MACGPNRPFDMQIFDNAEREVLIMRMMIMMIMVIMMMTMMMTMMEIRLSM